MTVFEKMRAVAMVLAAASIAVLPTAQALMVAKPSMAATSPLFRGHAASTAPSFASLAERAQMRKRRNWRHRAREGFAVAAFATALFITEPPEPAHAVVPPRDEIVQLETSTLQYLDSLVTSPSEQLWATINGRGGTSGGESVVTGGSPTSVAFDRGESTANGDLFIGSRPLGTITKTTTYAGLAIIFAQVLVDIYNGIIDARSLPAPPLPNVLPQGTPEAVEMDVTMPADVNVGVSESKVGDAGSSPTIASMKRTKQALIAIAVGGGAILLAKKVSDGNDVKNGKVNGFSSSKTPIVSDPSSDEKEGSPALPDARLSDDQLRQPLESQSPKDYLDMLLSFESGDVQQSRETSSVADKKENLILEDYDEIGAATEAAAAIAAAEKAIAEASELFKPKDTSSTDGDNQDAIKDEIRQAEEDALLKAVDSEIEETKEEIDQPADIDTESSIAAEQLKISTTEFEGQVQESEPESVAFGFDKSESISEVPVMGEIESISDRVMDNSDGETIDIEEESSQTAGTPSQEPFFASKQTKVIEELDGEVEEDTAKESEKEVEDPALYEGTTVDMMEEIPEENNMEHEDRIIQEAVSGEEIMDDSTVTATTEELKEIAEPLFDDETDVISVASSTPEAEIRGNDQVLFGTFTASSDGEIVDPVYDEHSVSLINPKSDEHAMGTKSEESATSDSGIVPSSSPDESSATSAAPAYATTIEPNDQGANGAEEISLPFHGPFERESETTSPNLMPARMPKSVNQKFKDALRQPKHPKREEFLAQKYAEIKDLEERAFQILSDLGMVGNHDLE